MRVQPFLLALGAVIGHWGGADGVALCLFVWIFISALLLARHFRWF